MLERPKTYAECNEQERAVIHAACGGPLPPDASIQLDGDRLTIGHLGKSEVAQIERHWGVLGLSNQQ